MASESERSWNWLLGLLALLLLPALALGRLGLSVDRSWLFIAAGVMSLATFGVYAVDKGRAKSKGARVPEMVLHALEFFGGWPGAFAAQQIVRHKNAKGIYQLWFWAIVTVHQAVALDYLLGWPIFAAVRAAI